MATSSSMPPSFQWPLPEASTLQTGINQALLTGVLVEPVEFRVTPTGRTVAFLELEHRSLAKDLLPLERLELCMRVVATGSLAEQVRELHPGTPLQVEGRLNQQRRTRNGNLRWGRTELVALRIFPLPAPGIVTD
ncbi:MAG: single-stranded DNA-binding protein [Magnetococcales bacterium]|nr:single-stranded DNA-binding protein [Magnetococcales bacterium]